MILIVEACRGKPLLRPFRFRAEWRGKRTWRIGWLWWSISYYPEPKLRSFMEWVENTSWRHEIEGADRFIAAHASREGK